jgi:hypothetical protein
MILHSSVSATFPYSQRLALVFRLLQWGVTMQALQEAARIAARIREERRESAADLKEDDRLENGKHASGTGSTPSRITKNSDESVTSASSQPESDMPGPTVADGARPITQSGMGSSSPPMRNRRSSSPLLLVDPFNRMVTPAPPMQPLTIPSRAA